jgi:hypothetical protein
MILSNYLFVYLLPAGYHCSSPELRSAEESMELHIRMQGIEEGDELRRFVERRVRFAFDSFGEAVTFVRVRLADQNGPKGGVDKSCRVTALARPALTVLVEEVDADEHAAVSRAVGRAAATLRRALDRAHYPRLRKLF